MRFRADETTIRLDERWRSEMSAEDRAEFDVIAGRTNVRLPTGISTSRPGMIAAMRSLSTKLSRSDVPVMCSELSDTGNVIRSPHRCLSRLRT